MQTFNKELYNTAGVIELTVYYLYIDIDQTLIVVSEDQNISSSHPGKNDTNLSEDYIKATCTSLDYDKSTY